MSRLLIIFGVILVAIGILWPLARLGLGRLPGDIVLVERENFRLYIPLATSLIISLLVSVGLWFVNR